MEYSLPLISKVAVSANAGNVKIAPKTTNANITFGDNPKLRPEVSVLSFRL